MNFKVYAPLSEWYNRKGLDPRFIRLEPFSLKTISSGKNATYYNLFSINWEQLASTKIIRKNSKNKKYPCVNIGQVYKKKLGLDLSYYKKGLFLKKVLKISPIYFYYDPSNNLEKVLSEIPEYLFFNFLESWLKDSALKIRNRLELSYLKMIYSTLKEKELVHITDPRGIASLC